MLTLLYPIYRWLIFVPFFLINTAVLSSLCVLFSLVNQRFASRFIASPWAASSFLASLSRVRLSGAEYIDAKQSYVVVANHLSQFDILVLYGWLNLDLKWVMKKELRKVPFIGFATAAMGHIFLDRQNTQKAYESLQALKQTLPAGTSILFFPEGTRSNGVMKRFKRGAFSTAKALDLPILPITLKGTEKILPNGTLKLMPNVADLVLHKPIPLEAVRELDELSLAAHAQAIVAERALDESATVNQLTVEGVLVGEAVDDKADKKAESEKHLSR